MWLSTPFLILCKFDRGVMVFYHRSNHFLKESKYRSFCLAKAFALQTFPRFELAIWAITEHLCDLTWKHCLSLLIIVKSLKLAKYITFNNSCLQTYYAKLISTKPILFTRTRLCYSNSHLNWIWDLRILRIINSDVLITISFQKKVLVGSLNKSLVQ